MYFHMIKRSGMGVFCVGLGYGHFVPEVLKIGTYGDNCRACHTE